VRTNSYHWAKKLISINARTFPQSLDLHDLAPWQIDRLAVVPSRSSLLHHLRCFFRAGEVA
jgi:hypothetical protein